MSMVNLKMEERNPIPLGMIAFSDYAIDARVIRLAETAARNGYSVDLLTPRKRGPNRGGRQSRQPLSFGCQAV